jgi:uncharacterized membrane protein
MVYAGFSHLTFNRVDFQAQVPDWPLQRLSGLVIRYSRNSFGSWISFLEKERVTFGWVLALFFVLVFPGNIAQPRPKRCFGALNSDNSRLIRLFFQPVLIAWALWSAAFKFEEQQN